MTRSAAQPISVAIACGGTGGHLFPGLAVAEEFQARRCAVTLLISPKDVDQHGVRQARGMEILTLPAVAWQRGSRLNFVRGFLRSWVVARRHFKAHRVHAALGMGGFTSAPPVLAARGLGAKTFLHESNTVPGRANRWLSPVVDQVFVGFTPTASRLRARETTATGTPVRRTVHPRDAGACRAALGLEPNRPVVLVMGGSQGATGVNELVLSALPELAQRHPQWQWIHLTGARDLEHVRGAYTALGLRALVEPFRLDMEQVLAAATVAVSRAGASSLAEFAAMQLPSVLVPYPLAADDHQLHNAREFVFAGAALLLEQKTATPDRLASMLVELVENPMMREKTRTALEHRHSPRAAADIAEIVLTAIGVEIPKSVSQAQMGGAGDTLKVRAVA